jgi:uncharacterized Zn finger protein
MTSAGRNLFNPDQLLQIAGERSFARGQDYADHGHIALLSINGDGLLAAAFGTSDYTVWLKRPGPGISGHCSCPAYEDAGFCKHMAAAALVANEAARQGHDPPDRFKEMAARLAEMDRSQLQRLPLEMAREDWRALRSLALVLGFEWEDDFA